jgi:type II secretory ATPase GspE/PulE/Tfp pilus assembly ATPase PilB-like protein
MSNLDIAEKRMPQDGRININIDGRQIDLRISIVRTIFGEKAVLRILDKGNVIIGLEHLGFSPEVQEGFEREISRSMGIILVTGPTGSGKSTTLYSAISKVADNTKNVMTVEDPVEYNLEQVNQIPVAQKGGITFPTALRTILRQDPDIIMVGEIRDVETAEISIQAALTGHLVLSTLHTNDAVTAITRLIDMGIEPFLVASSVSCVLAQRLVRKICPKCKEPYLADPIILASLLSQCQNIDPDKLNKVKRGQLNLFKGRGCKSCGQTGYQGRIGVFELLTIDEDIQRKIVERAATSEIRKIALEKSMRTMLEDGLEKVFDGETTLTEVMRVIKET